MQGTYGRNSTHFPANLASRPPLLSPDTCLPLLPELFSSDVPEAAWLTHTLRPMCSPQTCSFSCVFYFSEGITTHSASPARNPSQNPHSPFAPQAVMKSCPFCFLIPLKCVSALLRPDPSVSRLDVCSSLPAVPSPTFPLLSISELFLLSHSHCVMSLL